MLAIRSDSLALGQVGALLVGACLATGDRIFATGSGSVSKIVLRSCGYTIMV